MFISASFLSRSLALAHLWLPLEKHCEVLFWNYNRLGDPLSWFISKGLHHSVPGLCCYCHVPPLFLPYNLVTLIFFYPRHLSFILNKLLSSSALPSSASVLFFTLCSVDKLRTSKRRSRKESFFSAFLPISVRHGLMVTQTFCHPWNIINSSRWWTASYGS